MRKVTDLQETKSVARAFVYLDPEVEKSMGIFVNHPFIGQRLMVCKEEGNLVLLDISKPDELHRIRRNIIETIDAVTDYSQFLIIMRKPYLPAFFQRTHHLLTEEDYATFLASLWTTVEFPNIDVNVTPPEFVKLFRRANKALLMDENEFERFEALPDEMTIYRGIRGRGKLQALSWTLELDKAEWFAKRWESHGKVYSAQIKKEDVLACFCSRNEAEVVVDYRKLKDITLVKEF